jgi:hypothetical protein
MANGTKIDPFTHETHPVAYRRDIGKQHKHVNFGTTPRATMQE